MRFFVASLTALVLTLSTASFAADHTTDSEATVKANLAATTAVLVDVREVDEWNAGHLRDASNLPLSELRAGRGLAALPRDKIIYLHCQSGRRVLPSADILLGAGFTEVRALPWGYPELVRRGFPQ